MTKRGWGLGAGGCGSEQKRGAARAHASTSSLSFLAAAHSLQPTAFFFSPPPASSFQHTVFSFSLPPASSLQPPAFCGAST